MKGPALFQGEIITYVQNIGENIEEIKKSSPELLGQFQSNLASLGKGEFVQMNGPSLFPRGDNYKIAKIH